MLFTNQFILTKHSCPPEFPAMQVEAGDYRLFYHKSLAVAVAENANVKIIVTGDLYDYENPDWSNREIAKSWLAENETFDEILHATYKYSGEYLVIFYHKKTFELKVFTDATAQFELFYSADKENEIVAGTNHRTVGLVVPLKKDTSPDAVRFFNSAAFKNRRAFIGNDTNYINLKRLIPNHYLDLNTGELVRYFPAEKMRKTTLEEASRKGAAMLRGYINAAANRYNLLIPVTAGWDTRVLLAASKEVAQKSIYFVYNVENHTADYDVKIPQKLFQKLNLPFHVYDQKIPTPGEKKNLIQEVEQDILFPNYRIHQRIKEFHKKYPGYLILNGNLSEILRLNLDEVYFLSPEKISFILKYPFLKYAVDRYSNWLKRNQKLFEYHHYRVLDMLHWEENCGNWVAKTKTERRIRGFKAFSPFNSRELILTLYGVHKKYRHKENPVLYRKMINLLWPDVLQVPVNPGVKQKAIKVTQLLGIFSVFRNLKLWWNMLKGMNKQL